MRTIPEISNADAVFPARISHLMPPMAAIPQEFKNPNSNNKWLQAQKDWFFEGISADQLIPKEGVDKMKALRVLKAIQRSFEPKHEHKEAAVAFLLSEWFSDYIEKKG